MADINSLRGTLESVAKEEQKVFEAKAQRQSFIELSGAGSLEDFLKKFDPDTPNKTAQAEFQKIKQNTFDPDKLIKARRAVAFMYSGMLCMKRHYEENELTLHVMGSPRMAWVLNELTQLKYTQEDGQPVWIAKE